MDLTEQIVSEARALEGAAYRHRGRGPIAYDCLGVVLKVLWRTGLAPESFDFTDYSQNVADYELQQHLDASPFVERLDSWRDAQPADILLQRFYSFLPASHLIVITRRENDALWGVHASNRVGKVVEQGIRHVERNIAAYRLKGVNP